MWELPSKAQCMCWLLNVRSFQIMLETVVDRNLWSKLGLIAIYITTVYLLFLGGKTTWARVITGIFRLTFLLLMIDVQPCLVNCVLLHCSTLDVWEDIHRFSRVQATEASVCPLCCSPFCCFSEEHLKWKFSPLCLRASCRSRICPSEPYQCHLWPSCRLLPVTLPF